MAMVMNSEENMFFSPGPLHRSHSQPQFITSQASYAKSQQKISYDTGFYGIGPPTESPQQVSSGTFNSTSTYTPSFGTFDHHEEDDDDQILFPSYDNYSGSVEDLEPPASPRTGHSYTVSPSNSTPVNVSRPGSPVPTEHAEDDTAVRTQPTRHVDYLSHNWNEEDIWASWKHIVSRRTAYANSVRLENACWRTWLKAKNNLQTVSPETLNWLKDCDVTWLYGPLQCGQSSFSIPSTTSSASNYVCNNLIKKPILKKRSMSEIMLQRSLSSSSLLKQATAAVQAQQSARCTPRSGLEGSGSDYFSFSTRRESGESSSVLPSVISSGVDSPETSERHIHFNPQVAQCIALDVKGDDEEHDVVVMDDYDSDSEDSGIIMKPTESGKKLPPMGGKKPSKPSTTESKTIAMLPSTTLKCQDEKPKESRTTSPTLSSSSSTETIRAGGLPSNGIFIGADKDEDDDMDWPINNRFMGRRDSVAVTHDRLESFHSSENHHSTDFHSADTKAPHYGEPAGMRRTSSGMFMPYDEDEDDMVSEGLFGKVVDTVNTAKDIAHVIWNVGWRR